MQEQLVSELKVSAVVVISWIFIIFADARTTWSRWLWTTNRLWLAEFLLSLLMQEQRLIDEIIINSLWLAEFLLSLLMQEQQMGL